MEGERERAEKDNTKRKVKKEYIYIQRESTEKIQEDRGRENRERKIESINFFFFFSSLL